MESQSSTQLENSISINISLKRDWVNTDFVAGYEGSN